VNPAAPPAPIETPHEAVDQLIARVLGRAHQMAEALNEPNRARAILHAGDAEQAVGARRRRA
jgi:hypothetical protein